MPQIEKAVEQAKWVDKAKIQQRKFQGLLRSLTETSKVASEQLLNRDFERHFNEECKTSEGPGRDVAVSRQAGSGDPEKGGRQRRTSAQRRAVGRRAESHRARRFSCRSFAEAPCARSFSTIRSIAWTTGGMAEVVNRIVALSDTRQVIVFTHNIWFTTELLARFEKRTQDCSYYDVARDGDENRHRKQGHASPF